MLVIYSIAVLPPKQEFFESFCLSQECTSKCWNQLVGGSCIKLLDKFWTSIKLLQSRLFNNHCTHCFQMQAISKLLRIIIYTINFEWSFDESFMFKFLKVKVNFTGFENKEWVIKTLSIISTDFYPTFNSQTKSEFFTSAQESQISRLLTKL